jgi:hypothetical protein
MSSGETNIQLGTGDDDTLSGGFSGIPSAEVAGERTTEGPGRTGSV